MALAPNTSYPAGTPGLNTSTPNGAVYTPVPVGQQTTSPSSNLQPKPNTTSTPAPKDLSGTYANVNGTIYNTVTKQKFSNPADFFKDSGQTSFNNLKFNTSYTPTGNETVYGSTPTPLNFGTPASTNSGASTGTLQTLAAQTAAQNAGTATSTGNPAATTTPANNGATYTPPNQGTTGVSSGGTVGNLVGLSQTQNPNYVAAQNQVTSLGQQISGLNTDAANQQANISGSPFGLSEQLGQSGILQQLLASKQAALTPQYNAAVAELNAANTQSSQQTTAAQGAANAAAPTYNVSPGTLTGQPTQPNGGLGGTSTAAGTSNINSLVGQRPSASSPGTTEYYNTQTGQGFSTPQALADFVNSQTNAGVTAQNVFQYLQNPTATAGSSSLAGVSPQLMQTYASMLASGNQASIPASVTGNMALMAQLQQMVGGGSFNNNVALGQGAANQSNASVAGSATTTANANVYFQAVSDMSTLQANISNIQQFGNQVIANMPTGVNPTDSTVLNSTIQDFTQKYANNPQYAALLTNIQGFQARVSALLGSGEIPSAATAGATQIADGTLPVGSMAAVVKQIQAEANVMTSTQQAKVDAAKANMNGGSSTNNSTTLGLF